MKFFKFLIISFLIVGLISCACRGTKDPAIRYGNSTLLSNPHSVGGGKSLPVNNFYRRLPGCYIACYSHDPNGGVYPVSSTIYVKGLVRVNGLYLDRVCQPQAYFFKDISKEAFFKNLCNKYIPTCNHNDCWAGGDTGEFFGIS